MFSVAQSFGGVVLLLIIGIVRVRGFTCLTEQKISGLISPIVLH